MTFTYSKHYDLVFHVLAHMKVSNASNLYDESYINWISQNKKDYSFDIIPAISSLEKYYNENFERLRKINFMPYYYNSYEVMKNQFLSYEMFTMKDKKYFIEPFIYILDSESEFYFRYWDATTEHIISTKRDIENYFIEKLSKFAFIFEYYQQPLKILFSYSITKNGRGIIGDSFFVSVVKYPFSMDYIHYSLFFALHEYTHSFTNPLLQKQINMSDGSHYQSEILCILADYYLIKAVDETLLPNYINIFCNEKPEEDEFLKKYAISDELNILLQDELKKILKSRK